MTATVMKRLRNYFVTGLIVLLPIVITVTVFWNLFKKVDGFLGELITHYTGRSLPGLGFVAMIVVIAFVGLFAQNFIGRRFISIGDWFLARIPFINSVYTGLQQIASVIFADRERFFREAVMFEYPRRGIWSVGFVTNSGRDEFPIGDDTSPELVTIFLPTTPNPTSGFFLILRREDVTPIGMPVEDAVKMIVSGGAVLPRDIPPPERPPAEPIEP